METRRKGMEKEQKRLLENGTALESGEAGFGGQGQSVAKTLRACGG